MEISLHGQKYAPFSIHGFVVTLSGVKDMVFFTMFCKYEIKGIFLPKFAMCMLQF